MNIETIDSVVNALVKSIEANENIVLKGMFDEISFSGSSSGESEATSQVGFRTYQNMGAIIIEAVLQAGMNYERAVKPRVTRFLKEHSDVRTTSGFLELIQMVDIENVINWKGEKINRIIQLAELLKMQRIETEQDLSDWLRNELNVLKLKNIKGIKDKTVDYLKLLCGHDDTVAIDLHLMNFIRENTNFDIDLSYSMAKQILISTAEKMQVKPAQLDYGIWKYMSQRTREDWMKTGPETVEVEKMTCANCFNQLRDKLYVFCPYCGEKIDWREKVKQ